MVTGNTEELPQAAELPASAAQGDILYYDGTNWISASFHDYAGGATLQTSETISADGWYYCWLDPDTAIVNVRMKITATNTDVDDLATVTAYLVGNK